MYLVFVLYALFASVFTISKTGLEYVQPFFFVGSRMAVAGVILLSYQFCFHRSQFVLRKENWKQFLGLALFNIYLTNVLEFWGLQYLTSFKTCFIYSLSPFLSAFLSFLIFSETLSLKKWTGLLIGIAGILPVLLTQTTAEERAGQIFLFSWAELAVMGAALCSVLGWIFLKQLVQKEGYSPVLANGVSMLAGGIFSLGHSYVVENWNPVPVSESLPFIECALLLILISNLICYNLYGYLLKHYSATFISLAGLSTPLFTALLGWVFLGEQVTWPFALSMVLLSCGLILFHQEEAAVPAEA
ncbi:MAG: DMT family transporter [Parachlamydia sp.]|nr:DMT family transporter [Parachlamydia sp.]